MNLRRIKKLRKVLAELPARQVRMDTLLKINRDTETLKEARNPSCGTVGCIAGWAICIFGKPTIVLDIHRYRWPLSNVGSCDIKSPCDQAAEYLDLSNSEASHMFLGKWHPLGSAANLEEGYLSVVPRRAILRYLDKVIAEKNPMVCL